ncbi:hypothetical protein BH09PAT2_BH09PAT2_07830 [soil metagenome]
MRNTILSAGLNLFLFLFVAVAAASAATLNFNPSSVSTQKDGTFSVDVVADAGTEQITGTDIYVLYDPQYLQLQTVTAGSFFPKSDNIPSTGKLYIWGVIENQGEYKTGQGVVATLTFKTLQGGNNTVRFDCNLSNAETSKILKNDINATNVINCGGNGTLLVTAPGSGTTGTPASGTSTTSTTTTVTTLPRSGVYENVLKYAVPGLILMFVGLALRFSIR